MRWTKEYIICNHYLYDILFEDKPTLVPFFFFPPASGISSPPTTPTQLTKPSPPFPLEENRNLPMRQEERFRSLSSPPDTGQVFSMPSAKPPLTASSAPITTSHMVSTLRLLFPS